MESQMPFEREWDHMVVLDAARFDVFRDTYSDFLEGELKPVRSNASATPEWVHKNFDGSMNIEYFSANPFINSLDHPIDTPGNVRYSTVPSEHVREVHDLWDTHWDDESGTVLPKDVAQIYMETETRGRTVIHFMQPHKPFLGHGSGGVLREGFRQLKSTGEMSAFQRLTGRYGPAIADRVFRSSIVTEIGLLSGLDIRSMAKALGGDTREVMMRYHRENMERALARVENLVDNMDGSIVVTSDHGEAFGEQGVWGHDTETHIQPLVKVPWLSVTN